MLDSDAAIAFLADRDATARYVASVCTMSRVLTEAAPGTRLCFNTAPENTVEALRR